MTGMRFVDTNVLLYAVSTDPRERAKAGIALSILDDRDLALSVQVLQEFYVQSTRRTKDGALTHEQAVSLIEAFLRFPVQETTLELMQAALASTRRFWISYRDAAIIEAARLAGCRVLLSEDLNNGQDYGGVRVQNPF
jgi:predicted nucleic acid-binding protein